MTATFNDAAIINENEHFKAIRPLPRSFPNLGYFRTKTSRATTAMFENLIKQLKESGATVRVWHTKRLWITWEGKP